MRRSSLILLGSYWIFSFIATHTPAGAVPDTRASDKTLHTVGYAGLSLLLLIALAANGMPPRRRLLWAALIIPLYAAFDELTQPLVNRHASVLDWLFDGLGLLIAMALFEGLRRVLKKRTPRSAAPI